MSTSGTYSFNYTRDQIIKSAARKIGAIASGETPDANLIQDFSDQLNIMVKGWNATGLHIWTEEEATLFVQPNQTAYTLGGTTNDQIAWVQASNPQSAFNITLLSAGAGIAATSIHVLSNLGFGANFFVGVQLNNGNISWQQQVGSAVGNIITLNNGLGGAANSGNAVFVYQTQVQRPLRVVSARRLAFNGLIETPMILLSRLDYRALPNKADPGTVTQLFYDPRGGANNQGIMYLWPAPQDITSAINFTWLRPLQDFDNPGDIGDLPTEWLNALIYNLAYQMAVEYDVPEPRYQRLQEAAAGALDLAMGWDREAESYYFGFNTDQTGP